MIAITGPEFLNYSVTVVTLVVLEGLLSADNALVLAVMVKNLPGEQRNKALKYGILGAFFFRAIGVLLAGHLIKYWYLKAAGALYLFLLAAKHFWNKYRASKAEAGVEVKPADAPSFWRVVFAVELTDIAFSIDSIIAAVALSDNIYVVYLGGILGIITMRFVATFFLSLLDTYAALETSAYLLVAWIALKLGLEIIHDLRFPELAEGHGHGMPSWLFWGVMGILFFGAFLFKNKKAPEDSALSTTNDSGIPPS
jgi:YkoY family integral membrane protein